MSQQGAILSRDYQYGIFGVAMGFEAQKTALYLPTVSVGSDLSSFDTATPITGASSLVWTKPSGAGENSIVIQWPRSGVFVAANASCTFRLRYDSGLSTSGQAGIIHGLTATLAHGVALANVGGNIKLALRGDIDDGNYWSSTTTLVAGTVYIVQWKTWRRQGGTQFFWWGHVKLRDSSGTLLEDSGPIAMMSQTLGWSGCDYVTFGNEALLTDALTYTVDDVVSVANGAWAPDYASVVKVANDSTEGTDTDFTLGAGASEAVAVQDAAPDNDTTYIERLATSGEQSYNNANSGISLAGSEKILGLGVYALGRLADDPINVDATSSTGYATASSVTLSHTVANVTARGIYVAISILGSTVTVSGTPQYAGQNLTSIGTTVNGNNRVYWYFRANPTTGANNITITFTASTDHVVSAISLNGVNTATPATVTATGTGGTQSVSQTVLQNNSINLEAFACDDTAVTVGSGQTGLVSSPYTGANGSGSASYKLDTVYLQSTTLQYDNVGAGNVWAMRGIMVSPRTSGNTVWSPTFFIGGTQYGSVSATGKVFNTITNTYAVNTRIYEPAPAGGWVVADIDAGEQGVGTGFGASVTRRITQIVFEAAYGLVAALEAKHYGFTMQQAVNRASTY